MRATLFRVALALTLLPGASALQAQTAPVRLMLFGEATYTETERQIADGFSLGQVVAHLNASLSPRLLVFAEGTLTPTGGPFSPSVERLILRYDFRDWLKVSGGRYHTPVSWWNTAFHHGSWLQTSVARPRMVRFGTPLVPIHFMGLLAEGSLPTGPLIVAYEAGVGNGRQGAIGLPGDAGDDNGALAMLGGLRLRTLAIPGAELGVHGYVDQVDQGPGARVDERMLSAHVAVQRQFELIAEYMLIRHEPDFGPSQGEAFDTKSWYVHLGYRLPPPLLGLRPYARYESIEPAAGDPLFSPGHAYDALIAGVRWDFSDYAAIKAEYRDEELFGGDQGQTLLLNASFVIPNLLGGGQGVAGH